MRRLLYMLFVLLFCVSCAYGMYLRKGDDAFASGDYDTALKHYQAAADADPKSEEAANKVQMAKEKIVEEHAAVAQDALANGDLLGAMVAARKAWDKLPDATPTKQLIQDVSNATFARAQELANAKDFANALMLYQTLGETLPSEVEKTVPHAGEVKDRWTAELQERATTAEAAGRRGDAMLNWAKLAALTNDPGHGGKRDELRNQILTEWTYWVQLSGRGGEAYENVVAGLSGASPATSLRVAERLPSGRKPHAKAQFKYGRPKFSTDTTTHTETAQYQSGTRQVPNPFYKSKQNRVLDEERRLVDAENDVTKLENDVTRYEEQVAREGDTPGTSTGAEQNLSRARSNLESARRKVQDQRNAVQRAKEDLADTPQTTEEPVFSDHTYTVTTHTLTGEMAIEGTITHPDERQGIIIDDAATATASDDSHPAQNIANVAEDRLTLPNEGQLTVQMYRQAIDKTRAAVTTSFNNWRGALVEKAITAPTDDERVDLMVIYIVTNPGDVTPKVPADLSALRGIPDSVKVLTP